MSRIRIIMLSLLAVFAVSAVASGSASASICLRVAVAHTGTFEKNTCLAPVGTEKEFVAAKKIEGKVAGGAANEYCAEVEAGEPSTFKNNKCTEAETGTGKFTKVLLVWEINGKPIAAGAKETTTDEGTKQKLKVELAGVEIECAKVVSGTVTKGTLEELGKDTSGDIKYSGCVVLLPSGVECKVKSKGPDPFGQIEVANVNTELVAGSAGVLADKFSPKTGSTFVTLELGKKENAAHEAEEKCNASTPIVTAVTGVTVGKVENSSQSITFTKPAQKGSTLTAFGVEAILEGTIKVTATSGGTINGA